MSPNKIKVFFYFLLALLGFKLRVLCLAGRPSALLALVILEIQSCLSSRLTWTNILLFKLPTITGMTGMCYSAATSWLRCGVLSCPSPKPSMVGLEL
jgi:hypothetical protein